MKVVIHNTLVMIFIAFAITYCYSFSNVNQQATLSDISKTEMRYKKMDLEGKWVAEFDVQE